MDHDICLSSRAFWEWQVSPWTIMRDDRRNWELTQADWDVWSPKGLSGPAEASATGWKAGLRTLLLLPAGHSAPGWKAHPLLRWEMHRVGGGGRQEILPGKRRRLGEAGTADVHTWGKTSCRVNSSPRSKYGLEPRSDLQGVCETMWCMEMSPWWVFSLSWVTLIHMSNE